MYDEATAVAEDSAHTTTPAAPTPATHPLATPPEESPDLDRHAGPATQPRRSWAAGEPASPGLAAEIVAAVQEGTATPSEIVAGALARIAETDRWTNAFRVVDARDARQAAVALAKRVNLDALPMAGVPVSVDREWSGDPVVNRLRDAGAIVVGRTAVSELGLWPMTDAPGRITRNPWNTKRGAGGSAGGAAAAVAAGLVPVAHGDGGFWSVRVPAACCGVFGLQPGRTIGDTGGVLATTVDDAALVLAVLAARPDLACPEPPGHLRIALALNAPLRLSRRDPYWIDAARTAAAVAEAAGHRVEEAELPYGDIASALLPRWLTVALPDRTPDLPPRTRRHLAFGRLARRLHATRSTRIDRAEARLLEFFERYDAVITPALAASPPRATAWHHRGWAANLRTAARFAPFTPVWHLIGWPAASVPMGTHPHTATPLAAQLAAPPGREAALLGLGAQLERLHPWRRTVR
ncbi:amidase family protein [Nocardia puris]|uniref:amidase n=1 Tax=Nocardia puris TaxID=208602 RepID=A0A366DDM3_9NOCA|nr:amidase family protein [Nocardia puris]RBO87348.1 amidase [Nocardia puris]